MLMKIIMGLMPKFYFAEGEGGTAGGGGGNANEDTVTISKAELESLKGNVSQLEKDLNDTQAGLLDPDYLEYQANKGKDAKGGSEDEDPPAGGKGSKETPAASTGKTDPFEGFSDEQLEGMSDRRKAELVQKQLLVTLVPAIVSSLEKSIIPQVKNSIRSEQSLAEDKQVVGELRALVKEGKDVKAVQHEMEVLAELNPDWDTRKVYGEAVKFKRTSIASEGRQLTDAERKALAIAEPEKPNAGGAGEDNDSKKNFKTDSEAAEAAFESAGLK